MEIIAIVLLSAAFVMAALGIFIGMASLFRVARSRDEEQIPDFSSLPHVPKVSVVVYSKADSERLEKILSSLVTQDYPDFEIVVVFDASAEATAVLSERFKDFENLYITFVPPGSRNLSRRKLANTIGVKAAKGEVVLFTVDNAIISSDSWVTLMAAPFLNPEVQLSLGYSNVDFARMRGAEARWRRFETVLSDSEWIASALASSPWRGDRYNMAISRSLFFSHKGYAGSITLQDGDDDLFVREVATDTNTRMVLAPASILTVDWEEDTSRMWLDRKEERDFTARWLPKGPALRSGFLSFSQWGVLLMAVAAGVAGMPSFVPAVVALVILLSYWAAGIVAFRKAAPRMEVRPLLLSLPLFYLWRPVANFFFRLRHRRGCHNKRHYCINGH